MKILGIDLFPIRLTPIKRDYQAHHAGGFPSLATVIVRVNSDQDLCGLGEATAGTAYFNQTLGALVDWLRGYATALYRLESVRPVSHRRSSHPMDRGLR